MLLTIRRLHEFALRNVEGLGISTFEGHISSNLQCSVRSSNNKGIGEKIVPDRSETASCCGGSTHGTRDSMPLNKHGGRTEGNTPALQSFCQRSCFRRSLFPPAFECQYKLEIWKSVVCVTLNLIFLQFPLFCALTGILFGGTQSEAVGSHDPDYEWLF